jgi:hypothetical protein
MQADVKDIHASLPHKAGYIDATMYAVGEWKHDCSPRRAAADELNTMQCMCTHCTYAVLVYIFWRLLGFHKNNIELMQIMTEGIQPAKADPFAMKLEVNLTANCVATFHF